MDPNTSSATPEDWLAHASFLRRLTTDLVGDAQTAADLAQDTWVVALERPPRHAASLRGWLGRVARNLAINAHRGSSRRHERESEAARPEATESTHLSLERLEVQRVLFDLLVALPEEQRTVLYLRYYEGLTPSAIAERLETSVKTIKTRQMRALAALRSRLDERSRGDRRQWLEALAPLAIQPAAEFAGSSLGTVLGGVAMKKVLVAGFAVILALVAWWSFGRAPVELHEHHGAARTAEIARPASPVDALALESSVVSTTPRAVIEASEHARTGALDVRLSWSDGTPAASVGLVARCANDPAPRAEYVRAVTDAQGLAHFADLHPGKVRLRPDLRAPFDATVEAGATSSIAYTIPRGLDVTGRVVDANGGAVATASIWCSGEEINVAQMRHAADCATDGTFRLRDVSERTSFGARAHGHRPSPCVTPVNITVGSDGTRAVELSLGESGGRVRGRVLDPDGLPLARARVLAGPRGGHNVQLPSRIGATAPTPAAIETAADGTFELVDDLEPGVQPIHAMARGYPLWSGEIEVIAETTTSIEIRFVRPARVEGRVLDFEGRPIANVDVVAAKEERGGWYWNVFPPSRTESDADGRFALDWIAPGACELNAHDDRRPRIGRARSTVSCTPGATTTCELRLERGNVIAGRVEDSDGAPLAGWSVHADTQMHLTYPRSTRTGADGRFELLNLGGQAFDVSVRGPDLGPPRVTEPNVPVATKDLLLVVPDAHAGTEMLRGRVVDPDARSFADVVATLWRVGTKEGHFVGIDSRSGAFEARAQPGEYRLIFSRGSLRLLTTSVFVVEEGRTRELGDLEFPRTGRVEIALAAESDVFLDGLGLSRADLKLWLESGEPEVSEGLEFSGEVWRSEELQPGTRSITLIARQPKSRRGDADHEREVQLLAQVQRVVVRGAEVEIRSGETARFELALERAFRVRLVLVGVDPQDITITARDAAGVLLSRWRVSFVSTSDRLPYSIDLPVGRAVVEVRSGEDRVGRAEIEVDGGARDPTPIEVVLRKSP